MTGEIKAEPDRFDSEEYVGEDATGFTIGILPVWFALLPLLLSTLSALHKTRPECIDTSELVAQTQLEAQSAEISGVKVKNMGRVQEFMSV